MDLCLFFIPFATALSSWTAVYFVIKFIFYPVEPIVVGGAAFQGLLPKYRNEFASAIIAGLQGSAQMRTNLEKKMQNMQLGDNIEPIIKQNIDRIIIAIQEEFPMAKTFLHGSLAKKLKATAKQEVDLQMPQLRDAIVSDLICRIDLQKIVQQQLSSLDFTGMEHAFQNNLRQGIFEWALYAGLLGFVIGIAIVMILALIF